MTSFLTYTTIFLATGIASGNSPGLVTAYNNRVEGNTAITINQPPLQCFGGLGWRNKQYIGEDVTVIRAQDMKHFHVTIVDAEAPKHAWSMFNDGIALDVWGCPGLWGEEVFVVSYEER